MCENERKERSRYPEPAHFDKIHIKDVALFGEIAGRVVRVVGL